MNPKTEADAMRVGFRTAVTAIVLLGAAGCGDLTAGGASEAEVTVVGDGDGGGAIAGASDGDRPEAVGPATVTHPFEGTVAVTLNVFAVGSANGTATPVSISGGVQSVEVDIRGEVPVSLGAIVLPPGVYGGVRVVFTQIRAEVTAGIGPLPPLGAAEVVVDLGSSGTLTVEREFVLTVGRDDRLEVSVDLGAPAWIALVAPLPPPWVVTASQFEGALRIDARVR